MKRIDYKIFIILIIQFLVFALINGFGLLGRDDIYTIHTTSNNFLKVLHRAIYFEMQAPLYFLLMSVWREISDTLFWAKLFHYLSFMISTVYFYKILRILVANKKDLYILLFFFALHPFIFNISNDLRRYSLTLLFAVITLYYFIRIYIEGGDNRRNHSFFILFSTIGIFNDYYHVFLLASLGAGVLFSNFKNISVYLKDMIAPFAGFLILLRLVIYQFNTSGNWPVSYIDSNLFISSIKHIIYLAESQTYTFVNINLTGNILLRLVVLSALILFIKKESLKQNSVLYISAAFMILIYLLVIIALKSNTLLSTHYVAFSFPLLFLCFSLLLVNVFKNNYIRGIAVVFFIAVSYVSYHDIYNNLNRFQKNIILLTKKVDKMLPEQPVFVMIPKDAERINYYLNDPDKKVIGVPGQFDLKVYDYEDRTIESEEQIRSIFENAILPNTEFYVIIRGGTLESNTYNSQIMYDYLNENFKYLSQEKFGSFLIFRYRIITPDASS